MDGKGIWAVDKRFGNESTMMSKWKFAKHMHSTMEDAKSTQSASGRWLLQGNFRELAQAKNWSLMRSKNPFAAFEIISILI